MMDKKEKPITTPKELKDIGKKPVSKLKSVKC